MSKVNALELEKYIFGQAQPSAVDLECAILGAILLDKNAYTIVRDIVGPEKMYDDKNMIVFKTIDKLEKEGSAIDLLTVTEALRRNGMIKQIGGPHYVVELTGRVGSSANIEHHAYIVNQCWIQRELIKSAVKTIKASYSREDVFKILGRIDDDLMRVSNMKASGEMSLSSATRKANELALERIQRGGDMVGYPLFGIGPLDRAIGGAEIGDVIDIFGSPGEGKTSLVTSILTECCRVGRQAYFWTPETHVTRISEKFSAHVLDMEVSRIRMGEHISDPEKLRITEDAMRDHITLRNSPLDIPTMKRRVKTEVMRGTKLFIYDRLELFDEARGDFGRVASAVTDITAEMRSMATEYEIVFVVLSQMLKEHSGKDPKLQYVYGGTLMQGNLTKAIGVHNPSKHGKSELSSGVDSKGMGEAHIVKNNYGEECIVDLSFDGPKQMWFSEDDKLDALPEKETPFG